MKVDSVKVAEIAGVSRSTVSRVVNNYSNVPEETRLKVLKVIDELGYIPNTSAQVLAGKKSKTIGLFIYGDNNDKTKILDSGLSFGYYLDLINRVLKESLKYEYQLLVDVLNDSDFYKIESAFKNRSIAGSIMVGFKEGDKKLESLLKKYSPQVLVDYSKEQKYFDKDIFYINTKDFEGAKEATKHLISLGKKDILHISGDSTKLSGKERENGYVAAMIENSLEPRVFKGEYSDITTKSVIENILNENVKFDAIFSANDNMAYVIKDALDNRNLKDIEIIGFDNLRNTIPLGIMSVSPDLNGLAKKAVSFLLGDFDEKIEIVETNLIRDIDEYLKESRLNS